MKLTYLFSRSKAPGSKVIAWASSYEQLKNVKPNRIPSHVAVLMDGKLVIESVLETGVRLVPLDRWMEKNELLHALPSPDSDKSVSDVMDAALAMWDKKYDWIGIAFFAISFLRLIVFKTPLPEKNKWENKDKYFCSEFVGKITQQDLSMKSPAKLLDEWLEKIK